MIKDRLPELRAKSSSIRNREDSCSVKVYSDSLQLDDFFTELQDIYDTLEKVFQDIEELKKKHSIILTSPYENEMAEQQVDKLMQDVKAQFKKVRAKVKEYDQETKKLEKEEGEQATLYRIYHMQHMALLYWFTEGMVQYNKAQIDFRDACKTRIKHQLKITGRITSDEEVEEMIESGDSAVFSQGIIIQKQKARETLADIEARHEDILKLERSIRELHDMFVDLALLVESQGELVNSIEKNVSCTADFTEKGNKQLVQARNLQTKLRKTRIILIIVLLVILVVIGLIIYFNVK